MVYSELGSKRHAVRKGDPDSPLYWVGNDADWREVREQPRVALECPERCGVELISVENPAYPYTPRFFRVKPPHPPCDHWEPSPGYGGRESPQHDWLKNKLAMMVRDLGYGAVVEHWPTRADIYVESSPPFCLEIQLRSTSFDTRTQARESLGARVCWLIRDGLDTPGARESLARAQAVRFRVVNNRRRAVQPWRDPPGSVLHDSTRIEVFTPIASRPSSRLRTGESWFRTDGYLDARQFLDEILSERRRPYSGSELGLRQAAWALDADVADYSAFTKAMAARRAARPATDEVQVPGPRRVPSVQDRDDRSRSRGRTDDRSRAVIRKQAADDLARRILKIEARIAVLEERRTELAADADARESSVKVQLTMEEELEMRGLIGQLKVLRRQVALLTAATNTS